MNSIDEPDKSTDSSGVIPIAVQKEESIVEIPVNVFSFYCQKLILINKKSLFEYGKNYVVDNLELPNNVEKAWHQINTVLYFSKSVPVFSISASISSSATLNCVIMGSSVNLPLFRFSLSVIWCFGGYLMQGRHEAYEPKDWLIIS